MHKIVKLYNSINQFGVDNNLELEIIEPGHIQYTMPVEQKHLATPIAIHGGALSAMMDAILGVAALSKTAYDGKLVATIEFKINYLAPARPGDLLLGIGKVIQKGNRIVICEGEIRNQEEGTLIAKGTGTFSAYPIEKSGILEHLTPEQQEILGPEYFS